MALPRPGDPLVTYRGVVTEHDKPEDTSARAVIGIPDAKTYVPRARRSMPELSTDAHTQSIINVVLMYVFLGISDNEIAHLLHTSIPEIRMIREMAAFQETFGMLFNELISANSQSLQARIASFQADAVQNVMDMADSDIDPEFMPAKVKLQANQDIMDRGGLSPDVLYGKNQQGDDQTLKIELIQTTEGKATTINIDLTRKRK